MSYPVSLKEFYSTHNGVNTLLVKKNNKREVPPPIYNPCNGATDSAQLNIQYRGSDWGRGISYAVEVNGVIWNDEFYENLLDRSSWWNEVEFSVAGYNFRTSLDEDNTTGIITVLPHHDTDYIRVKLLPPPDVDTSNSLLGVIGGGVVEYDTFTTAAEFCLKPSQKQPISCIGASDRFAFSTEPLGSSFAMSASVMSEDSYGVSELIYNVKMDGVDYGVIDFVQTPNPMFGSVGLSFTQDPNGYGEGMLKLKGGVIGAGHRFQLTSVPSRGGNNIHEVYLELENDGEVHVPTVEHNRETRDVEFCFMALSRCDGAPDFLSFSHYDDEDGEPGYSQVFPLVYNVTLNGTDYGETNFIVGEDEPYLTEFGEYTVQYIPGRWGGGGLGLSGGPVGVPAHIVLEPVDAIRSNINSPEMNRTVEYDNVTKRIEFCLTRHECSGATKNIELFASPGGSSEENYTQFFHSIEFDGYVINADNSVDLLSQGYTSTEDGAIDVSVYSNETDGTITIALQSNSNHGVRKVTIKPPNDGENFVTGVSTLSNPTVVEHAGGVITGCIDIWQPQ